MNAIRYKDLVDILRRQNKVLYFKFLIVIAIAVIEGVLLFKEFVR